VTVAVFDTNVLASGAIAKTGPVASLFDAWQRGQVQVMISTHIRSEPERALTNSYFASRLDEVSRQAFLDLVRTTSTLVTITVPVPTIAKTGGDNLVLATAESAGASYLVTGDAELQRFGRYKATIIVSPRQFLDHHASTFS
jgi:putative PIN family toxin of toxin-antitoxin system